jgi:hypothetical protein
MEEKKQKDKPETWESGIKILKRMQVIIPLKLLLVCNQIAEKVREDEFSIVTNIAEKDDIEMTLSEEFYIPKQIVSHSSIEYQPDEYKFNCVIHRHPDGFNSFSSTDQNYINQNFELSILYTKRDGFVAGLYNLKHENGYLIQLPVEIYVNYGIDDIELTNIQKPAPLMVIEKPSRKSKARHDRNKLESTFDIDLERIDKEDSRKLLIEEKLEVTEQIQGIEFRLDNLEDAFFHQSSFATQPF